MKAPFFIGIILILLLATACRKNFDLAPAPGVVTAKEVFRDDDALASAIAGLYNQMLASGLSLSNGGSTIYGGLSADELRPSIASATIDAFYKNSLLPSNTAIQTDLWAPAYKLIYQTNAILEGIAASTHLSDSAKQRATGEALLIRSLEYFYLINFFGDIPLVTSTNYLTNSSLPRLDTRQISAYLIEDLIHAKSLLDLQPTTGHTRANGLVAAALLARIYLYSGNWQQAAAEASEIIQSGQFQMENDPSQVFLPQSREIIWQLDLDNHTSPEASYLLPPQPGQIPPYPLSDALLQGFEAGDERLTAWTKTVVVNNHSYVYPFKYRSPASPSPMQGYVVFRLAEQYLIRAEARTQLGQFSSGLADLNRSRSRAGLQPSIATDTPSLLAAIEKERRVELFCEWGHRWLDLKRWRKADSILSIIKGNNWQTTDQLYPIPWQQIQLNPLLTQNPGY